MADYTIIQGDRHRPKFQVFSEGNVEVDMTAGGRSIELRIQLGTASATVVTPTWTSQATGEGYFAFSAVTTAALPVGTYDVEFVYSDSDTDTQTFTGYTWLVRARSTA